MLTGLVCLICPFTIKYLMQDLWFSSRPLRLSQDSGYLQVFFKDLGRSVLPEVLNASCLGLLI